MKKEFTVYLEDIVDSVSHIEKYIKGVTKERFEVDELLQDAVIRRLQIIGEAAKRIPEDFKQQNSTIPWRLVTGMRDVLTHDYSEANVDRIWSTIQEDLPILKTQVKRLPGVS